MQCLQNPRHLGPGGIDPVTDPGGEHDVKGHKHDKCPRQTVVHTALGKGRRGPTHQPGPGENRQSRYQYQHLEPAGDLA